MGKRTATQANSLVCAQIVTVVLSLTPYREQKRNCRLPVKYTHEDGATYCTRHHNDILAQREREAERARFEAEWPTIKAAREQFEVDHAVDPCRACGHPYELHSQHDCQHVWNYNCGRDGHWRCGEPHCPCGLEPHERFVFREPTAAPVG